MKTHFGFTLIEMMITIAIAAILLAIAVPSFNQVIRNSRATSQTNELTTALAVARSEAVRRTTSVSVCASTNNTSCSGATDWATGWIVVRDSNNSGAPSVAEVLRVFPQMTGSTATGPTHVRYLGSGMLNTAAAQTIDLVPQGCTGTERRRIAISTTGRVSVTRVAC